MHNIRDRDNKFVKVQARSRSVFLLSSITTPKILVHEPTQDKAKAFPKSNKSYLNNVYCFNTQLMLFLMELMKKLRVKLTYI